MDAESLSSNKPEQEIAGRPLPRTDWLRVGRWVLRYLTLFVLAATILLTSFSWIGNYRSPGDMFSIERPFDYHLMPGRTVSIYSRRGYLFLYFLSDANLILPRRQLGVRTLTWSELHNSEGNVFVIDLKQFTNSSGVGFISDSQYVLLHALDGSVLKPPTPMLTTLWAKGGWGVVVPHWMVLVGAITMFLLVWNGFRFTLRGILIWMTVMLIILSIGVRTCTDMITERSEGKAIWKL